MFSPAIRRGVQEPVKVYFDWDLHRGRLTPRTAAGRWACNCWTGWHPAAGT